ncbi:hypothetical protein ACHAQH_004314 [Verticillium albo-atrum]
MSGRGGHRGGFSARHQAHNAFPGNHGQYPTQYPQGPQGMYPPQNGSQGQYAPSSSYSPPPSAPTGPMQQYGRGSNFRGGGAGFRGNQFGGARGGYRGNNFKSAQWNASQAIGARGSSAQGDDAKSQKSSNSAVASVKSDKDDADEHPNPFRPSEDLQVEDTSPPETAEDKGMAPPTRPPPSGPAAQSPASSVSSKFSFAFKASAKPTPAVPKPEISQKFNAAPPKKDPAQQADERDRGDREREQRARDDLERERERDRDRDRERDRRDREHRERDRRERDYRERDNRERDIPRGAPTEPASARGRQDSRHHQQPPPPGPKAAATTVPRTRIVKQKMKRLKPRLDLPADLVKSDSVYFRKPGNESVVGSGTYGKVFKGLHCYTKDLVALKKIRMEGEKDGFPVTAVREIKLLQSLRHPNVVELKEVMVEKNDCFMVFEYLSHDLTGLLNHPTFKLDAAQKKHLARQVFEGLDYLHVRGVLHRDLKAANILVSSDGILKIADFGLARFYAKRHQLDYTNRVITIWYRSPELLLGETRYGPACDIWSTACIMMEIFTRHATFPGDGGEISQLDKIYNVMGTPNKAEWPGLIDMPWFELLRPSYRRASSFAAKYRDKLTPAAYDLIWSILKYDPVKRPSAAEALQHAYFTTEEPPARQAIELADLDGDWHELESKALRKENERKEREARHAARSKEGRDSRQKDKDRKRENETHDQRGDAKRLHVEGQPPQPVDHAAVAAAAAHKG